MAGGGGVKKIFTYSFLMVSVLTWIGKIAIFYPRVVCFFSFIFSPIFFSIYFFFFILSPHFNVKTTAPFFFSPFCFRVHYKWEWCLSVHIIFFSLQLLILIFFFLMSLHFTICFNFTTQPSKIRMIARIATKAPYLILGLVFPVLKL